MNQEFSLPTHARWNALVAALPDPHLLQTAEWGQSKIQVGWKPSYLVWCADNQDSVKVYIDRWPSDVNVRAGAMVLSRGIPLGGLSARFRILYIPKGPLLDWQNEELRRQVILDLQNYARKQGAIFLKIDPDILLSQGIIPMGESFASSTGEDVQKLLHGNGWRYSQEQIQFRNTVLIDLIGPESDILAKMKQKTRYNIRLASRKGVTIRLGAPNDYPLLYHMYAETSRRDGFTIRDQSYYQKIWSTFPTYDHYSPSQPICQSLIAEVAGEPVAALILFIFGGKAWYLYGMSREMHRDKMPNYLLQWEAMRLSKSAGCRIYDLWGAPEVMGESDPLWGVYRFKEGLGGNLTHYLGAWDYPVRYWFYMLYTQTMPRILAIMRRRGKARTRQLAG